MINWYAGRLHCCSCGMLADSLTDHVCWLIPLLIICLDHKFPDDHQCCKSNIKEATGEYTGTKSYKCSFEDCERHELLPVLCDQCTRNFCLQHRHQQDHKCDKQDTSPSKPSKTAEHVQQIIASKQDKIPQNKLRGRKSSKTAAKVALMKMKMAAVGEKGIPETDKVYLQIYLPQGGENKTKPMFFSKVGGILQETENQRQWRIVKIKSYDMRHGDHYLCRSDEYHRKLPK
ncbi:hypothetical protein KUTeg_019992 [Tegillarca granosa]|uniref:AN1-type domain-containing protein n=1 Tax=Tegillarca granosa TaxID=220873 RepID=A0ABQ9EIA7_TEGGR|nr:hypothetical protein KUTeg_019992 [Tegillarca granosa]